MQDFLLVAEYFYTAVLLLLLKCVLLPLLPISSDNMLFPQFVQLGAKYNRHLTTGSCDVWCSRRFKRSTPLMLSMSVYLHETMNRPLTYKCTVQFAAVCEPVTFLM